MSDKSSPVAQVQNIVNASEVEYVMRCLLPNSGSFHSGPSGDTAYDEAYRQAISENLPPGFEVAWRTKGQWPVDKDGLTWVKIYRSTDEDKQRYWIDECHRLQRQMRKVQSLAMDIHGAAR